MLSYQNKDPSVYMLNNKELFDLSNYDKDNMLYVALYNKLLVNLKSSRNPSYFTPCYTFL